MKTLGEILKSLRKEKGVSMEEMIQELKKYGVSPSKSMISRWENDNAEPSMEYARILSRYFNVTLDYLLGLEIKKVPTNSENNSKNFLTVKDAMEFILKQPAIAAYGGYEPDKMTDEEILEFANELLNQLKLLGYKYKK